MSIFNVNKGDSRVKISDIVDELTKFGQVEIRELPPGLKLERKDLVFIPKDGPRAGEIHVIMIEFGRTGSYVNGVDLAKLLKEINQTKPEEKIRWAYATNLGIQPDLAIKSTMKGIKIFANIYDVDQLKWSVIEWATYRS
jgi:hypothetical protein